MASINRKTAFLFSLFGATLAAWSAFAPTAQGAIPSVSTNDCLSRKLNAVGKSLATRAGCFRRDAAEGVTDPACHQEASEKFTGGVDPADGVFARLEAKDPVGSATACLTFDDQDSLEADLVDYAAGIPAAAGSAAGKCDAAKIKCVGKYVSTTLRCAGKAATDSGTIDPACTNKAVARLANGSDACLDKAALQADCTNSGSQAAALQADADAFVQAAICSLDPANAGCPPPPPEALALAIVSVSNTAPGQNPEIVFTVHRDGVPLDILASPLARLVVTVAGPTTDYATYWQNAIQGSGSFGTLASDPGGFRYTMSTPMPAPATGSYGFGLEGYVQPGGPGGPRYASRNPVAFAAVTDAVAVPRRSVATDAKCENCHESLAAHAGSRRSIDYCVMCHHAENVNDERIARFEGVSVDAISEAMGFLTHRIHMGNRLTEPYVLGGFPSPTKANPAGTPIDYNLVPYPGDVSDCDDCHSAGGHRIPLAANLLPVVERTTLDCVEDPLADLDDYCDARVVGLEHRVPAETAACIGCHDAPVTAAHAEIMTTTDGVPTCAVCHSPGKSFDADLYHGATTP